MLGTRCVLLGDGGVYAAAEAATAVVASVAAVAAAAGSSSGVGNGAAIAPVVVFSVTTGLMVDTIAANACASAYKKDAALCVGNLLIMVLRMMERLEILGGLANPRDGVSGGHDVLVCWCCVLLLREEQRLLEE